MRNFLAVSAAIALSIAGASAQNGTTAIRFNGIPSSSSYQKVTSLDSNGNCALEPYSYKATIAPLDEEYSMIFRGPIKIAQIAVYTMGSSASKKRSARASPHHRRHGHQHFHEHNENKRGVGSEVIATINGVVESWANTYTGPTPAAAAAQAAPAANNVDAAMGTVTPTSAAPAAAATVNAGTGTWARQAYYNAAAGSASGMSFLANNNWVSYAKLGAILGYVSNAGTSQSQTPAILEDQLLADNVEIVVSTDSACNGDCGGVAEGAVANHGWAGGDKAFLAEYSMPLSGSRTGENPDKPGFWLLNTQIVNTQQYGACSCWPTGCGEFDVHEVLEPGDSQGYATMHMWNNFAGQAPQGIDRPTDSQTTIKIAAIITAGVAHVQVLPDSFSFDSTIDGSVISNFVNSAEAAQYTVNTDIGILPGWTAPS